MRNFLDDDWPFTPLGERRRPGACPPALAAVAIEWARHAGGPLLPMTCAVVQLPLAEAKLWLTPDTLRVGFRVMVLDQPADPHEVATQIDTVDLELARAQLHANVLAGHDLEPDLHALADPTGRPAGVIGNLHRGWTERHAQALRLPRLIDTAHDLVVDDDKRDCLALKSAADPDRGFPGSTADVEAAAFSALCRCLAVGLTAGLRLGHYDWRAGAFDTERAARRAGAETFEHIEEPCHRRPLW